MEKAATVPRPMRISTWINAAAHIILALQEINSREINPNQMIVLTVCSLHAGSAANVMPGEAVLKGTIRTMDLQVKEFARQRMREICEGVCSTFRATCDIDFIGGGIPAHGERQCSGRRDRRVYRRYAGRGYDLSHRTYDRIGGFLCFSQKSPARCSGLEPAARNKDMLMAFHDPRVTFNEDAIPMMAAVHAESAFRWLREHSLHIKPKL